VTGASAVRSGCESGVVDWDIAAIMADNTPSLASTA
jgi:hypothetical protein